MGLSKKGASYPNLMVKEPIWVQSLQANPYIPRFGLGICMIKNMSLVKKQAELPNFCVNGCLMFECHLHWWWQVFCNKVQDSACFCSAAACSCFFFSAASSSLRGRNKGTQRRAQEWYTTDMVSSTALPKLIKTCVSLSISAGIINCIILYCSHVK